MFYKLQSYNFFCIYANKIAFGRFYWCRVYGVGCKGERTRLWRYRTGGALQIFLGEQEYGTLCLQKYLRI